MTTSKFIPSTDTEKNVWLNNFGLKLPTHATTLGITPAEVALIQKDVVFYQYIINLQETHKQTLLNITAYKGLLKHANGQQHLSAIIPSIPVLPTAPPAVAEGVFDRISKLAVRIKASVNYTDSMGQDLGIIAPTQTINVATMQPDLKVMLDAGRPHIKCTKGYADAIDLYVDRKDGGGFVLIGRLLKLDYIDVVSLPNTTALAEWSYKAMYVIGNDNVGLMSPIVSIVVKKI